MSQTAPSTKLPSWLENVFTTVESIYHLEYKEEW